jgi:hypothetical protein
MKKLALITAALMLVTTPAFADPITVSETLTLKKQAVSSAFNARAEWNALTIYLQGVIEGTAAYQETLIKAGHAPLFCPPRNKSYSLEELFHYLEKTKADNQNRPAVTVLIEGYAKKYPCGK